MTISYELYLQKSTVCHPPKDTQELSLQMRRDCIPPPPKVCIHSYEIVLQYWREARWTPVSSTRALFCIETSENKLGWWRQWSEKRLKAKCISWGVICSVLTFKIHFSCFIAIGQILLVMFGCTNCTARLTKWVDLFICLWGPLEN